jgi:hypothetical protein
LVTPATVTEILIPCFNEQGRVSAVVSAVRRQLPRARVVVVDDSSSDATALEATNAGALVLAHGCNLGYGAALETGYLHARHANIDIVAQMDGDGQHRADQLPLILQPVMDGSADIVIGSRYGAAGSRMHIPALRRAGHRFFSVLVRLLTGLRLADPTSGFQCMNRRAVDFFASGSFPCDYPDSDVILMAHLAGLRIREVPVIMEDRHGGVSMHAGLMPLYYGIKMLLSMLMVLLNLRVWHRFAKTRASAAGAP